MHIGSGCEGHQVLQHVTKLFHWLNQELWYRNVLFFLTMFAGLSCAKLCFKCLTFTAFNGTLEEFKHKSQNVTFPTGHFRISSDHLLTEHSLSWDVLRFDENSWGRSVLWGGLCQMHNVIIKMLYLWCDCWCLAYFIVAASNLEYAKENKTFFY